MSKELARLDAAERLLAKVQTIPEVRKADADLAALEKWARAHQLDLSDQNRITELRALFQRKGGELVASLPKGTKGRGHKGGKSSTLEHFRIAEGSASRWLLISTLAEKLIRDIVAARTAAGQGITLGYFYGLARPAKPVDVPPEFPQGPFRAIVIDPPWPISKIDFERRDVERQTMDYATQDLEAIRQLPIPALAHPDGSHVYLWVTHRFLPYGLELFGAWGVRYECVLTWMKGTAQPLWWRFTTEHCLFGKIGSLAPLRKGMAVHFEAAQQRHSHKPDVFFELVRAVSPGPRLTMYDTERSDFEAWGVPHAVAEL